MTLSIDPYVVLMTVLVTLTCGIFIWYATPRDETIHVRQIRYFSHFFFLTSLSWALVLTRTEASAELNMFFTNTVTYISFALLLNGFRVRAKESTIPLLWILFPALFISAVESLFLSASDQFVYRLFLTYSIWFIIVFFAYQLIKEENPSKGKSASLVSFAITVIFIIVSIILQLLGVTFDYVYLIFCYTIFYVTLFASISSLMLSDEVAKHQRDAVTDQLTGLNNRRFFIEQGGKLLSSARRHDFPMSIILCDIDHFKSINDTFGHSIGDSAIREIAQILNESVRNGDFLARFGGEEFIALLPQTDLKGAIDVAERMRRLTEQKEIQVPNSMINLTASFGVTEIDGLDLDANIIRADKALYQAKSNGRNRIEIAAD